MHLMMPTSSPAITVEDDNGSQKASRKEPGEKEGVKIPSVGPADIAIFWDYENVRIPAWCSASTATEGIRNKVAKYGRIVEKRLYYDSRQPSEHPHQEPSSICPVLLWLIVQAATERRPWIRSSL